MSHTKKQQVKETIVQRPGDGAQRSNANKSIAIAGSLEDDLKKCQVVLKDAERLLRKEQNKSNQVLATLETARNALSQAQEVIDADPLPERAQPPARIQQRDNLKLVRILN